MHRRSTFAALAAALVFSSCSDDTAGPGGGAVDTQYQPSIDFHSAWVSSLWGHPSGDVYASGIFLMRFDGETWTPVILPDDHSGGVRTWGAANGDLYIVGEYSMHRYDGTDWHRIARPAEVRDICTVGNGELFVVGGNHRLYHYDGSSWEVDSLMTDYAWGDPWHRVTGGDPDDMFIVGSSGWLGHYDGQNWTAQYMGSQRDFSDGWKAPGGPLFVIPHDSLFTYDGAELDHVDVGPFYRVESVIGRSATEVYCSAAYDYPYNSVFQYDGNAWTRVADVEGQINLVWGDRASDRLFAAGDGVVWELKDERAEPSLGLRVFDNEFHDLWGSEEAGVYVIGTDAYRYFDGEWVDLKKRDLTSREAYSIWGRSAEEIYAVGPGTILHYDGQAWTGVSGGAQHNLYAVNGNEDEVFAVGGGGAIVRYDGHAWSRMESGTTYDLYGVYAWRDGAFAVGEAGAVMHYDGREWRPFPSPVSWTILDILGFGANDVFAVGRGTTEMCHFDGKKWKPIFIGYTGGYNYSIWGTSARNLFIGQGSGKVIHFDGREWSVLPRVTIATVRSVWGTADGEIIGATGGGVIRYSR